jgi:elongation factor P--(R)-beta-lysine ligase
MMRIVSSPWWHPDIYEDRRPFLKKRSKIITTLRAWFADQDFCEVETPVLQLSPGNETHLHAFATQGLGPSGASQALMLRTSPEFALKKLLSAGEPRLVEFAPVFRNRERGRLHHPAFTMLEWYRAHQPYTELMQDCETILALAAESADTRLIAFRGMSADPALSVERLSVAEAFKRYAQIDVLSTINADGHVDRDDFEVKIRASGIRTAPDDTWSDLFSRVLTEKIEPFLGQGRATILMEYPAPEAALSRRCKHDGRVCERFELYLCGVELANAFGELTDAKEQRLRFENAMAEKQRLYEESYPIDEDFLEALAIMPPASGAALGLDRLVMLCAGAQRIEQVLWAPVADF